MSYFDYQGETKDDIGGAGNAFETGVYKFKVITASEKTSKAGNKYVSVVMDSWKENNDKGPAVYANFFPFSDKDFPKQMFANFCKIATGGTKIEALQELVSKAGLVVLQNGDSGYLEPVVNGFFTKERKSATGKEDNILEAIKIATESVKQQKTQTKAATVTAAEDSDLPF